MSKKSGPGGSIDFLFEMRTVVHTRFRENISPRFEETRIGDGQPWWQIIPSLTNPTPHLTKWCWCDHNNLITSTTCGRRSRLSFIRHRNGVKSNVCFFKVKPGWGPSKILMPTMFILFWPQKFSHFHSRKELPPGYEVLLFVVTEDLCPT